MAEALSGATGALQGTVGGMLNKGSAWLDNIFPPEKRNEIMAKISKFATEKPMLASFIASQVALTGFPLGLFIIMTITLVIFALIAGLIIALVGALLFIVVCVGFALIILLPTLFLTTGAATFIWLWGVGGYYLLKWFNKKEIPGIHTEMGEGQWNAIMGKGKAEQGSQDADGESKDGEAGGNEKQKPPKLGNGTAKEGKGGAAGKGMNGVADKLGDAKEAADVGKHAGNATNKAQNTVGGVKGGVTGAVGL